MAWLAGRGYEAVTLQQWWDAWHGGPPLPARPVVFTFDDGSPTRMLFRGDGVPGPRRELRALGLPVRS